MAETGFTENNAFNEQKQNDDVPRLSFSNLLRPEENILGGSEHSSGRPDPLFEFLTPQTQTHTDFSDQNDVVFCGKVIKSQSLRKSDHGGAAYNRRRVAASRRFSADLDSRSQRVNITSLTSMSDKARRRMFMFGPVKFRPEMELSAIKQRLARRPPPEKSQVKVVRPILRERSCLLVGLLTRSFGCIP